MKKFLKILGITVGVLAAFILIAIVLLLKSLPSAGEVGQYLRPSTAKTAIKIADKKNQLVPNPTPAASPTEATTGHKEDFTANIKSEEDRQLMEDMLDTTKPLSDVCAHLRNANLIQLHGYSLKDFGQKYKDSVLSEDKDPVIQAIKPSLRYVFNQPQMKNLMKEAMDAAEKGEDDSFINKASFYAKAFAAYQELQSNQKNIEQLMDRSYHLMVLSKVIAKRPELVNDSAINHYCQDIESALNSASPTSYEEERKEFNEFFHETGLDPKDVDYDPNYRTELKIEFAKNTLNMKGGWIDTVLKPNAAEIEALRKEAEKKTK